MTEAQALNARLAPERRTGGLVFVHAARRLIEAIIDQMTDPDAGPLADAVIEAVEVDARAIRRIGIEPIVNRKRRPSGIGKRTDMPAWFEDGQPRRINPVTL